MYFTQPYFKEDIPNQILHILSTLLLWLKVSTLLLVNILPYMISQPSHKEISCWNYYRLLYRPIHQFVCWIERNITFNCETLSIMSSYGASKDISIHV